MFNMAEGWIKLHRKLLENPLWTCETFTRGQAWVDLILLANHEYGFFFKRGVKIEIQRGQVGISEVGLSDRWKWSRTKVRKFIKDLEKEQQVIHQQNNVTQIVTILKYDEYQQNEQQVRQQKDSRKTPKEQQKDINKNNKEEIEGKESKEVDIHEKTKFDIFNDWLSENYPNVSKMSKQMTEANLNTLIDKYGREKVYDIFMQMENKKGLTKLYESVYYTANNWIKRNEK